MDERQPLIIAAWAEAPSGPGWSNSLVWVILQDPYTSALCQVAIQSTELTPEMWTLFSVSEAAADAMRTAVSNAVTGRGLVLR